MPENTKFAKFRREASTLESQRATVVCQPAQSYRSNSCFRVAIVSGNDEYEHVPNKSFQKTSNRLPLKGAGPEETNSYSINARQLRCASRNA